MRVEDLNIYYGIDFESGRVVDVTRHVFDKCIDKRGNIRIPKTDKNALFCTDPFVGQQKYIFLVYDEKVVRMCSEYEELFLSNRFQNGLNHFDIVYYINLDHREDRYEDINTELARTNIDRDKIHRIPGVYRKDFGALGCAESHCIVLERFLESPETNQTCLVLEDDFEFTQPQDVINRMIDKIVYNDIEFDLLFLSCNILKKQSLIESPFLVRVLNGQTTSGYVVTRAFAPVLLENFRESVKKLQAIGFPKHEVCLDNHMKQLQTAYRWYCMEPKIGRQRQGYSDIEKRMVNYLC